MTLILAIIIAGLLLIIGILIFSTEQDESSQTEPLEAEDSGLPIRIQEEDERQSRAQVEELNHLNMRNQSLSDEVRKKDDQIQKLQEELTLKENADHQPISPGEDLQQLKETVQMLQDQLKERDQKIVQFEEQFTQKDNELGASQELLRSLQEQEKKWLQERGELEESIKKVKEFNGYLIEKDKMLQQELLKSRAQAMGLEKISEDFKTQLDAMSKKVQ